MSGGDQLAAIIASHAGTERPLLPILHDVQAAFGCVDVGAEAAIAPARNLSRAEVHGVVSFYHDFAAQAAACPVVQLCRAEACQARGVGTLVPAAEAAADARAKLKAVYCLFGGWATNCPECKVTAVQVAPSNGPTDLQETYPSSRGGSLPRLQTSGCRTFHPYGRSDRPRPRGARRCSVEHGTPYPCLLGTKNDRGAPDR